MEKTIGKMIGKVSRTYSVKNDVGDKVNLTTVFDFTNAPDEVIKDWLGANRAINYQSTLRKKTAAEIKSLNGQTVVCDGSKAKVQVDPMTAFLAQATAEGIDVNDKVAMSEYIMSRLGK